MGKVVRCSCGVEIRAANDRELIETVRAHARDAHGMELSDEQILAMAEIEQ
jgi:predicted small metal-binding protein